MRSFEPVIVSCALTGAIHSPSLSPHLPVTPAELIEQGVEAAEAGASILHVHVRDPETGEPVTDVDLFREVAAGIHAETDAIIQPTTGGPPNQVPTERVRVVPALEPEMASCNMGSINFGLYQIAEAVDEFEHDWEREFYEGTWETVFQNTFGDLRTILPIFDENGTMPELECYDVGHLYNAKHFVDRGMIETPIHCQFVLGIHGGIGADGDNLAHLIQTAEKLFGDDYSFSVIGAGRHQFALGLQAVAAGGHVRVGLEDSLYLRRGELAETNAQQVEKVIDLVWEVAGREPAQPDEVREFLGLKGGDNIAV